MKIFKRITAAILSFSLFLAFTPFLIKVMASSADLPAFPGAEGFGAYSTGGSGGEVYHVTSLADTNEQGTFRHAVTSGGNEPRTVVFDVSGYIRLTSILAITRSNLTIAGQTAPGGGIFIVTDGKRVDFKGCNNIILRYMHFANGIGGSDDTVNLAQVNNMIIDHCTFVWGGDENLSIKNSTNVTVQWSIIAEGLRPHSMGGLIESNTISIHHCIYAHNNDRNPKTKGIIDFVNNIVYDYGSQAFVAGGNSASKGFGNIVGNYFIKGPATSDGNNYIIHGGNANYSMYVDGNFFDSSKTGAVNGSVVTKSNVENQATIPFMSERFDYPLINTDSAAVAYEKVLKYAGDVYHRLPIDDKIVNDIINKSGGLVMFPDSSIGFSEIKTETVPKSTSGDGIPDDWKRANNLNINTAYNTTINSATGYTWLDTYLNDIVTSTFPDGIPPKTLSTRPAPQIPKRLAFDFGVATTETDEGFIRVTTGTEYKTGRTTYGIESVLVSGATVYTSRDRSNYSEEKDNINRTWIGFTGNTDPENNKIIFRVDLEPGVYSVRVRTGDLDGSTKSSTGIRLLDGDREIAPKQIMTATVGGAEAPKFLMDNVTVNSGILRLEFNGSVLRICSVEIYKYPAAETEELALDKAECFAVGINWALNDEAEKYEVYRRTPNGQYTLLGETFDTEFNDITVLPDTAYEYSVVSINYLGHKSAYSAALPVRTPVKTAPYAPIGLNAAEITSKNVDLIWEKPLGAESYNIYRKAAADSAFTLIGTSKVENYTDSTVKEETSYIYTVKAVNNIGESAGAVDLIVTTRKMPSGVPQKPAVLEVKEITSDSVTLSWNANVGNTDYYEIYRSSGQSDNFVSLATTTEISFKDITVINNELYTYRVTAVNESGSSEAAEQTVLTKYISYKFDIGPSTAPADGYTRITSDSLKTDDVKYGFTNNINMEMRTRKAPSYDSMRRTQIMITVKTAFVFDVPDGLYSCRIVMGDGDFNDYAHEYYVNGVLISKGASKQNPTGFFRDDIIEVEAKNGSGVVIDIVNGRFACFELVQVLPVVENVIAKAEGTSSVSLTWTSDYKAESYTVYRKLQGDAELVKIAETSQNSFTDTDVLTGDEYVYSVTMVNSNGETEISELTTVSLVNSSVKKPSEPVINQTGATADYTALSWTAVEGAQKYYIYRKIGDNFVLIGETTKTVYADRSVYPSESFEYYIAAVNEGGRSDNSGIVTTPVAVAPVAPDGLIKAYAFSYGAKIIWNPTAGEWQGYVVYRSESEDGIYEKIASGVDESYFIDYTVEPGKTYFYKVTAANIIGESDYSNIVKASVTGLKYMFHFGTSSSVVEQGYVKISPVSPRYDGITNTYGFEPGIDLDSRDRKSNIATEDPTRSTLILTNMTGVGHFYTDLPNGIYQLKMYIGDCAFGGATQLRINSGETVTYADKSSGLYALDRMHIVDLTVEITNNQLDIELVGVNTTDNKLCVLELTELTRTPQETAPMRELNFTAAQVNNIDLDEEDINDLSGSNETETPEPEKDSVSIFIIIGIIVSVVAVLGAAVFFILKKKGIITAKEKKHI